MLRGIGRRACVEGAESPAQKEQYRLVEFTCGVTVSRSGTRQEFRPSNSMHGSLGDFRYIQTPRNRPSRALNADAVHCQLLVVVSPRIAQGADDPAGGGAAELRIAMRQLHDQELRVGPIVD